MLRGREIKRWGAEIVASSSSVNAESLYDIEGGQVIVTNNDNKIDNASTDKNEGFDPSRRRFVKNTGIAIGGVAGGSLIGGLLTNQFTTEDANAPKEESVSKKRPMEARMFFTRFEDFVVLEQATERIYPEDDNGPGAIELGVPYFIDKQLAGSWGLNGKDYRKGPFEGSDAASEDSRLTRGNLFLNGLRKMNELSQEQFDTTFDDADEDQQIGILEDFENGEIDMKGVASDSFFKLLRDTTLEGVYSDPLYGGNRNMEGWKMIEFPGARSSYDDVVDTDEFVELDPVSLTDYQQKS